MTVLLLGLLLLVERCRTLGPAAAYTSYSRTGQVISEARDVETVLEASLGLPSVCDQRFEESPVRIRKQRISLTMALRKLSQRLVGMDATSSRRAVVRDARFGRLVRLAAEACPPKYDEARDAWLAEQVEAFRLVSTLAQNGDGVMQLWRREIGQGLSLLKPCEAKDVTAARWASERFALYAGVSTHLERLRAAERALKLPFEVIPGALDGQDIDFDQLRQSLPLNADTVLTRSGALVQERRHTAWLADADDIGGLAYSGKIMEPQLFPAEVCRLRDSVCDRLGLPVKYDCALVNLYPTGGAACKYHHDPEHGTYWDTDQAVLSVGEPRRFAFRDRQGTIHVYHVFNNDVVHMFRDCQEKYQHCVFKSQDNQTNVGPRISFVFKRALLRPNGKKGHGPPSAQKAHLSADAPGRAHVPRTGSKRKRPTRRSRTSSASVIAPHSSSSTKRKRSRPSSRR